MDIVADSLAEIGRYAHSLAEKLRRDVDVRTTATLEEALAGAQFVVTAVEVERNLYPEGLGRRSHSPRYGQELVTAATGIAARRRTIGPSCEAAGRQRTKKRDER
jgi:alpha-galactosidase/6-phospho-beta-glucosidase family protein